MFYPGFYFDSTYLLLVPAIIIAFWAQLKIDNAYKKYKNVYREDILISPKFK